MAEKRPRLALRVTEAADALGVSERTLRRWMRDEGLPFARIGGSVLLPVADVRGWLSERVESDQRAEALADEVLLGL